MGPSKVGESPIVLGLFKLVRGEEGVELLPAYPAVHPSTLLRANGWTHYFQIDDSMKRPWVRDTDLIVSRQIANSGSKPR